MDPAPREETVGTERAAPEDIDAVARVFVRSFPARVAHWFTREDHALAFYRDLFELMRRVHGETFFVARHAGALAGFLVLVRPGRSLVGGLVGSSLLFGAGWRALSGRYGFSARFARAVLRGLGPSEGRPAEPWTRSPHVYAVAVDEAYAGRGVGRALMERARTAATPPGRLWLYVEADNSSARTFYERLGLRPALLEGDRVAMVWDSGEVSS